MRIEHIKERRVLNTPRNYIRKTNYVYGFSNAVNWMDASHGTNTIINSGAITYWEDKITQLKYSQNTASAQPRFMTKPTGYNGYPAIDFYSNARWLLSESGKGIKLTKFFAVAFVANVSVFNSNSNCLIGMSGSNLDRIILAGGGSGPALTQGISFFNANTLLLGTTIRDGAVHITVITESMIVVDGVVISTGNIPISDNLWNQLGGTGATSTTSFNGVLAELIVYDRYLTSDEAVNLCDNINSKYAIY